MIVMLEDNKEYGQGTKLIDVVKSFHVVIPFSTETVGIGHMPDTDCLRVCQCMAKF